MVRHVAHKTRRDRLRAAKVCVNSGPKSRAEHGPVVKAGKCQRCLDVHAASRPSKPDLVVRWSKRDRALLYIAEPSTGGFLAYVLETHPTHLDTPLARELDARGYDLSTLRLTIRKKKT